MLRLSTSIICLSLLLFLQYGKITNYLYCEWQAKVVQSLPDCDCVQILDGVFDSGEENVPAIGHQQTKWGEYECTQSGSHNVVATIQPDNNQSFFLLQLPSLFSEPAFRPPAGC